jgi:hypothetical protein
MLAKNETCIIDNGKSYIFNLGGRCIKEDAGNLSGYMAGALDLPCISILSSNGVVDIGVSETGKEFKRYSSSLDAMACAMQVQKCGGFIKMLRRDGEQDGVKFNQLIFVYKEGSSLNTILSAINAKED